MENKTNKQDKSLFTVLQEDVKKWRKAYEVEQKNYRTMKARLDAVIQDKDKRISQLSDMRCKDAEDYHRLERKYVWLYNHSGLITRWLFKREFGV